MHRESSDGHFLNRNSTKKKTEMEKGKEKAKER